MIPCSDNPFPIALDAPASQLTSDFNSFIAQIRRVICSHLSDNRGRIVPPIHHQNWRLIHADLNWDIPATMLNYLGMDGLQITKVGDVVQRIYRKRIRGERFIRVEEGTHPFPRNANFTVEIGETIIAVVRQAREELPLGVGGV